MANTGPNVTSCDIFCKVIDNYGDIGVCWRLARQLAHEHHLTVRLWVDDLAACARLAPDLKPELAQQSLAGVTVCAWALAEQPPIEPADLVIEAFACNPPIAYLQAMARRPRAPVWINLEYLSAEPWVADCHGLASPHPALALKKYFFFPGFSAHTGGLLREADYAQRRNALLEAPALQADFWQRLGSPLPRPEALRISLFCYENAALPALLDLWQSSPQTIDCVVPEGRILPQIAAWARQPLAPGAVLQRGALRVSVLPFMAQEDYDRLLALCHINFVRGEDSFVRAQWACQPLVWHIYQQAENAQRDKLAAFLALYGQGLPAFANKALGDFWWAWEQQSAAAQAWPALLAAQPVLAQHAAHWADFLAQQTNLAANLLIFCKNLLE